MGADLDLLAGVGDVGVRQTAVDDADLARADRSAQARDDDADEAEDIRRGGHRGRAWARVGRVNAVMAQLSFEPTRLPGAPPTPVRRYAENGTPVRPLRKQFGGIRSGTRVRRRQSCS